MNCGHKKARVGARAIEVFQMSLQTISDLFSQKNANGRQQTPVDTQAMRVDKQFNHAMDLPKRVGFGVERVKITPDLAQYYLTFNRVNRAVKQNSVDEYADEMMRGEWAENGESIKFSKTQCLLDGQHRLLAIIKSGVTLHMLVVFGMEDDSRTKIDNGEARKATDTLTYQGLNKWDAKIAGAAAHVLINHLNGIPLSSNIKRLNREVEAFYLDYPKFKSSIDFVAELPKKNTPIAHSPALVLHYLFAQKDVGQADSFIEKLFSGESLPKTSPIYQLREKLRQGQVSGQPYSKREQFHACIKAWNYVRHRKNLSSSRSLFPRSDEPLPEIE